MKNLVKRQHGFTLIELLIVIAILGILTVAVIPNITRYMQSATLAAANTEAQTVQTAVDAYMADSGGIVPVSINDVSEWMKRSPKGSYSIDENGDIQGESYPGQPDFEWLNGKWVKM